MFDPGYPCNLCGVRSDVACKHRPAEPEIVRPEGIADKRRDPATYYQNAGGRNFQRRRKQKAKKA
jgi:hypothetical protein